MNTFLLYLRPPQKCPGFFWRKAYLKAIVSGFKLLQRWTRESLKNKPFCLALGKDWTLSRDLVDLREIHTDLSWTRKHRKAYTVEQEDLKNITQILSEEQLGEEGPVRILIQG